MKIIQKQCKRWFKRVSGWNFAA